MKRPLIGITCTNMANEQGREGFRLNHSYIRAVLIAGGTPVLAPAALLSMPQGEEALRSLFDTLHGLLLPGGADLDPSLYGQTPHEKTGSPDKAIDALEIKLAQWALDERKPVLGICRGQQCLNVAAGGTLFQDIPSQVTDPLAHRVEPRDAMAHEMIVEPDSRLSDLLGTTFLSVNSLHHQSVRDVAPGFLVVARAPDGVIEGIERPDHPFAVAVQFHPEELVPGHAASARLLRAFVEQCATA
ncbi:MAG: putative glutamine amidotransferase [Chloroflexi bacterium]|nr:putative glutamine amidotransferase [Chloroflexota bacterium]